MPRSDKNKSAHDKRVNQEAEALKNKGFDVEADVKGYPQPGTISGLRPDVVARKGKVRRIIEVETPDSKDSSRDKGQQKAFRRAADRSKNTTFRRVITED